MMYFSDTLEEESRGFQTFSFSVVFRFTHPRRTAPRALPYLERREGNPREKNTGNVGRKPRKRGAKGAGHTGGGAKGPLWNLGEPRKRSSAPCRHGASAVQSAAGGGGDFPSGDRVSASSSHPACSAAEAAVAAAAVPASPPPPPRPILRPAALAGRGNSSCRRPPLPQRR